VADHDQNKETVRLSELNEELNESLRRCRDLLKTHRSQLAANKNDELGPDEDEEAREA
jgi:nitrate/nitrite-specific signal transduction histidine kinase